MEIHTEALICVISIVYPYHLLREKLLCLHTILVRCEAML